MTSVAFMTSSIQNAASGDVSGDMNTLSSATRDPHFPKNPKSALGPPFAPAFTEASEAGKTIY